MIKLMVVHSKEEENMSYFKLLITISVVFGVISLLCLILSIIYLLKGNENKNVLFNAMASLFTGLVSVLSYVNTSVPSPTILPLDYETEIYNKEVMVTIKSNDENTFETYYSLNGDDPQDGIKYTDKFIVTESTTVCARNKFLWIWSDISKNAYFVNQDDGDIDEPMYFDLADEIKQIQRTYNDFQENKNKALHSSVYPQISFYYVLNKIASIEIQGGYKNINYSRIYYFNENNQLYFAFIFDKLKENRLYFKDNILIRYIDESGETYDLYDNLDTCEWEEFALKESYEIFDNLNQ